MNCRGYLIQRFGVDRAIAYTVLSKVLQVIGSTGTVLLIVHSLSQLEQGYYYTLLSLVGLQAIFELGFSFVILQLAAHECVCLTFRSDGQITGDPVAHARLASILQKATRWYLGSAALMALLLLPLGVLFFPRHASSGVVAWRGPWILAVVASATAFFLNPAFAFLEGCGQVPQVARMRTEQAMAAIVTAWTAMACHRGLYSPACVLIGYTLVGAIFLWKRRGLLLPLLRYPTGNNAVQWHTEVWSFQWKIAVTWLCSYLVLQCFTPMLFAVRGPVEAGRMGMSVSITGYLSSMVLAWMSTKAAPFGQMIARCEFRELDGLFFRTLRQSLVLLMVIECGIVAALITAQYVLPKLLLRVVPLTLFALLLLTTISTYVMQSLGIYLRAHKSEPLLLQSVVLASVTLGGAFIGVCRWGMAGVIGTYFACNSAGLLWAALVFQKQRKAHLHIEANGASSLLETTAGSVCASAQSKVAAC